MTKEKKKKYEIKDEFFAMNYDSIPWGEFDSLNEREKNFAFWYVFRGDSKHPNPVHHKPYTCAIHVGYKKSYAKDWYKKIKENDLLNRCLKYLEDYFYTESAKKLVEIANAQDEARLSFDVRKFFDTEIVENEETGQTYTKVSLKPFSEWTEEMAMAVDGIEINQSGIANVKFANRERERKLVRDRVDILTKDKNSDEFDVETTVDIIRENLATAKVTVKLKNENVRKNAENYIENSENQPDYD